ncbi:MAG: VOC family protein [Chloroflexi bacterium]|nr:VOC family protein [Chloroflexota bacterium]
MTSDRTYVRHGFGSVRPYLHGPVELLEFVRHTFDAVELERHKFGPESFHVELQIGDSVLVIEAGELPPEIPAWIGAIYVYVEDVDAVFDRALKRGAKPVAQLEDKPYQERQAGFLDIAGNTWWIATHRQPS